MFAAFGRNDNKNGANSKSFKGGVREWQTGRRIGSGQRARQTQKIALSNAGAMAERGFASVWRAPRCHPRVAAISGRFQFWSLIFFSR
ncbi:MAG: hypothetical protein AcusKO_22990 [Acuticoccus sp.]